MLFAMKKVKGGCIIVLILVAALLVCVLFFGVVRAKYDLAWARADLLANDVFVYYSRHGTLPLEVDLFCDEIAKECGEDMAAYYRRYLDKNFVVQKHSCDEVVKGADYVKPKSGALANDGCVNDAYEAKIVNVRLRACLDNWEYEKSNGIHKQEHYRWQK